jgi:ribonuclease E
VIKVRQIMLVQVVKEERGNKGAALTTYLSLPGRYCVLMPNTARGGGISRKITNAADRKKLKEIAGELTVPEGAGLIIRTAGAERTKTEIKRDYEYLMRLWEQIRELTLKSIAPAPIYEEGNLIKRAIRDLYSRDIDEVLVEGAEGYRTAKDFMKMIMPSHAKNVKQHTEGLPLFARYQVESYLAAMFNPTVQLKSGGYIVIGITEALVAIDVNSGRSTKEGSIEETALKTNLEAAEEVARQLRLRDLAGLIVIDFIDMEERRNNAAVEKRLKEKLKTDRARIQVGRISGFGLLEMSRQRLRPGMIEATTQPCPACHGTGLIRSDDSLGLAILRQLEEEGTRRRSREVLLRAPVQIVNFLMNQKREHIAAIEARYGLSIRIEADPALVSPDFTIEKFKTATRVVPEVVAPVVSLDTSGMENDDADVEEEAAEADIEASETADVVAGDTDGAEGDGQQPRKKRRRRRRRRGGGQNGGENGDRDGAEDSYSQSAETDDDDSEDRAAADMTGPDRGEGAAPAAFADDGAATEETPKPKRRRSRSSTKKPAGEAQATEAIPAEAGGEATADEAATQPQVDAPPDTPKAPARKPTRRKVDADDAAAADQPEAQASEPDATAEPPAAKPARKRAPRKTAAQKAAEAEPAAQAEPAQDGPVFGTVRGAPAEADAGGGSDQAEPAQPTPEEAAQPADAGASETPEADGAPRRRGWWSLRR